jgi:glycosyltransferase involved in cell wall biosynthesis
VIALSENTRRDVEKCGVAPEKIHVIYGGGDVKAEREIAWGRVEELRRERKLPEEFFLYVGAIQPRKNVPLLVRAFAEARRGHGLRQELVLAGPQGAATDEVLKIAGELGIEGQVHLLGYVDDWELPLLYKQATAFVLPTLYEGFTLVTLEAMAYGTPVIVTDTSSIREGVGEAALLVQPNDVLVMADAMNRVVRDSDLRTSCIERGKERAAAFTWEKSAEKTLELYRQVELRSAREKKTRVRVGAF